MGNVGGGSAHLCYICLEKASDAVGNAYNLVGLCHRHYEEYQKARKFLTRMFKQTLEIQALMNVKQKYILEQQTRES